MWVRVSVYVGGGDDDDDDWLLSPTNVRIYMVIYIYMVGEGECVLCMRWCGCVWSVFVPGEVVYVGLNVSVTIP